MYKVIFDTPAETKEQEIVASHPQSISSTDDFLTNIRIFSTDFILKDDHDISRISSTVHMIKFRSNAWSRDQLIFFIYHRNNSIGESMINSMK